MFPDKPKTKRRLAYAALIAVAIAALLWHASRRGATGPAEGTELAGQIERPTTDRATLRVATFNIHSGKGSDGRRDLDRVAGCLQDLDLVGLCEVRGEALWQPDDQAAQLGRTLGMAWLFAPASLESHHHQFGNGLLSRLPATFWQRIPLARRFHHSHRNMVLVGVEHRGRTVHVLLTHVTRGDDRDRSAQLRAAIALFTALAEPAILLGDLNTTADDPQIRGLLARPGVVDPVGEVLGPKTPERIDWILVRGLRTVDAGIVDNGASDHPMVWAELE